MKEDGGGGGNTIGSDDIARAAKEGSRNGVEAENVRGRGSAAGH